MDSRRRPRESATPSGSSPQNHQTPAFFTLDMPEGAQIIQGGALTVEPMDGNTRTPRGKELARLEL